MNKITKLGVSALCGTLAAVSAANAGEMTVTGGVDMSWISLDDHIYAINHLIMNGKCNGVFNLTSPNPVRQKTFSKTLGKVLRRPAFAPIPKFPMKILFGELANPLLFEGQKVIPEKILDSGFTFTHESLENALRDCLGRW